jgi:hypothetical protein
MIRAVESCHAWLEELAYHIKVTPGAFQRPDVGARVALVKVQAAKVYLNFQLVYLLMTPVSGTRVMREGSSASLWRVRLLLSSRIFIDLLILLYSLGATKDGKGKVVEQISRDVRIFVVGGGSEEILDDLSIRSTVLAATRKGKL